MPKIVRNYKLLSHISVYIIEIDNNERGVIGDFTTISNIRTPNMTMF